VGHDIATRGFRIFFGW